MRPWLLQALCLILLAACATFAHAQTPTPIYRCVGTHGEPKFSSQPCGPAVQLASTGTDTATISESYGFGDVCPGSPEALRQAIAGAFGRHDVNRLSGIIVWRGVDQTSARARLRSLADWLKQPLAGVAISAATGPPPAIAARPAPVVSAGGTAEGITTSLPPIGFEISTADGGTRNFGVTESEGCWWLTFD